MLQGRGNGSFGYAVVDKMASRPNWCRPNGNKPLALSGNFHSSTVRADPAKRRNYSRSRLLFFNKREAKQEFGAGGGGGGWGGGGGGGRARYDTVLCELSQEFFLMMPTRSP